MESANIQIWDEFCRIVLNFFPNQKKNLIFVDYGKREEMDIGKSHR